MQIRRVMDEKGQHRLEGGAEWSVVWFDLDTIDSYFHRDVNKNQIKRLSQSNRDAFLREAGPTMEKLGYHTDGTCRNGPETRPIEELKKAA
jgi:hypothetical protein